MTSSKNVLVQSSSPSPSYYLLQAEISRCTDVILLTGSLALLTIGILASIGQFNFIGTTNAAYLSYGMYSSAALFLIIEIVKTSIAHDISKNHTHHTQQIDSTLPTSSNISESIPSNDIMPFVLKNRPINDVINYSKLSRTTKSRTPKVIRKLRHYRIKSSPNHSTSNNPTYHTQHTNSTAPSLSKDETPIEAKDRPVPKHHSKRSEKYSEPLTQNEILKFKAFVWKTSFQEPVSNFIIKAIDRPSFQKDPRAYLKDWEAMSGNRESQPIEDIARMILWSLIETQREGIKEIKGLSRYGTSTKTL